MVIVTAQTGRIGALFAASLLLTLSGAVATAQQKDSQPSGSNTATTQAQQPPASNTKPADATEKPAATPMTPAEARQAQIVADTQRLYKLTQELKEEVAKSNKDTLSVPVIKKADEVEKLARSLKERMRAPQ